MATLAPAGHNLGKSPNLCEMRIKPGHDKTPEVLRWPGGPGDLGLKGGLCRLHNIAPVDGHHGHCVRGTIVGQGIGHVQHQTRMKIAVPEKI